MSSLVTWQMLANPLFWLLPVCHREQFVRCVGAAKGNVQAKQHVMRVMQTWILVGALIISLFISMLDMDNSVMANKGETLYDQIFGFICIFGASCALMGPIVMNSIMYLCASSVSDENFDHFMAMGRGFIYLSELLTWGMCLACMLCFAFLGLIMFSDHADLPASFPGFNGMLMAWVSFGLIASLLFVVTYHINVLCAATIHGGLLSSNRDSDVEVWAHENENYGKVVDHIVREAVLYKDVEILMQHYIRIRGGKE